MFDWKRWVLPGLVVVTLLTFASVILRQNAVETDLTARTLAALKANHPWTAVEARGRDLVLNGKAPSESAIVEAIDLAKEIAGVRAVESKAELLPLQDPYRLSVARSATQLTLEGFVPDENVHQALVSIAEATVPGVEMVDNLQLARGAPENFLPIAGYAMAQLAGLKEGAVEIDGNSLSVRGEATSSKAFENVTGALEATLPGVELGEVEIEPPSVSPYVWSLSREGDQIVIQGNAPSLARRETIAADIRSAVRDLRLENRLLIASGLPESIDWTAATAYLAGQLAHLAKGTIVIIDGAVSVEGDAASAQAFENLTEAFDRELPAGLQLASADINRPVVSPYVWKLEKNEDGAFNMSGHVPDTETWERLAGAIRSQAAGQLNEATEIGSGAPEGFESAALAAIGVAGRLSDARVSIEDQAIVIKGETLTGIAANELRAQLRQAVPAGYKVELEVAVRLPGAPLEPADCHSNLAGALQSGSVSFETGSADIRGELLGLLDRLAFTLRRCPQARFEVGGHTDLEGTEEANLELSTARARAVVDRLIRAGVRYSRLAAKGYGESFPIADNSTEEGRARNRRIEFRIIR